MYKQESQHYKYNYSQTRSGVFFLYDFFAYLWKFICDDEYNNIDSSVFLSTHVVSLPRFSSSQCENLCCRDAASLTCWLTLIDMIFSFTSNIIFNLFHRHSRQGSLYCVFVMAGMARQPLTKGGAEFQIQLCSLCDIQVSLPPSLTATLWCPSLSFCAKWNLRKLNLFIRSPAHNAAALQ